MASKRAFVLLLLLSVAGWSEDDWHKIHGTGLTVYTRQDVKGAIQAYEHGRKFQRIIEVTLGLKITHPDPVVMVQPPDPPRYRPLRSASAHRYVRALERDQDDVIVISKFGERSASRIKRDCIWLTLKRAQPRLPFWLRLGIAQVYQAAELTHGKWRIGDPIFTRSIKIGMLGPDELREVREFPRDWAARFRLAVQTWLPTHMLMFSDTYALKFLAFRDEMTRGASFDEALADVYRKDSVDFHDDLDSYVFKPKKSVFLANDQVRVVPPEVERAEDLDVELLLAKALTMGGHEARALESYEGLVIDHGDDARVFYDFALALGTQPETRERRIELLTNAIRLDPRHNDARRLLGMLHLRHGDFRQALQTLGMVRKVSPERAFDFFRGLAICYYENGRQSEAKDAVDRAASYAHGADSEAILNELRRYVSGKTPSGSAPDGLLAGLPQ